MSLIEEVYMDIQIYGEHLDVSEELKGHAESKCQKFKTLMGSGIVKLRLKTNEEKKAIVNIDLHHNGHDFHISHMADDMKSSITAAVNKAHKLLNEKNQKDKKISKIKLNLD